MRIEKQNTLGEDSFRLSARVREALNLTHELPHHAGIQDLQAQLSLLPKDLQASEGLRCAAKLIQDAAYAHAKQVPGDQVVGLMLLSANVESAAERITESTDQD